VEAAQQLVRLMRSAKNIGEAFDGRTLNPAFVVNPEPLPNRRIRPMQWLLPSSHR
jgi:hypothetical protein